MACIWHDQRVAIEIRPYPADADYRPWAERIASAFLDEATDADLKDWERLSERDRLLAAYDGERIVGGAGAFTFRLTVPGGEVGAAGVTAVGVAPTHRRRGILREMMRRQLDDVRERGEPVAILWASEGIIYQRFGYGLASLTANFEVDRAKTAYRLPAEREGDVRLVDRKEAARLFPPVYDDVRRAWPGFFNRNDAFWELQILADPERHRRGAGPKFYALYESNGRAEGYAIYRVRQEGEGRASRDVLEVRELIAGSNRATRDLWRFVFDIDLIHAIRADRVQPDHPLLLTVAEPRRLDFTLGDALWLRLLDLPAAFAARSYREAGSVTFEVSDGFCPWNAGCWRLETDGKKAQLEPAGDKPDLVVDVTDLAAAYLGAFSFAQLARAGRVVERSKGATERADRLFATQRAPWCPQVF
jgi:predicted acetyltransferase